MKIAVLGTGNMGGAIARGLIEKNICSKDEIICTAKRKESLEKIAAEFPGIQTTTDNASAVIAADFVILAVKPWYIEGIIKEIRGNVANSAAIISVAAGITFENMDKFFGEKIAIFRVIPNTAIMLAQSMTFIAKHNATASQEETVISMFRSLGEVLVIDEKQMTAGTALASCGIAFAMRYAESAIRTGETLGFDPATSEKIVLQTIKGAISVLENSSAGVPAEIRRVTTPGGITERGLKAMTESGFEDSIAAGLNACM